MSRAEILTWANYFPRIAAFVSAAPTMWREMFRLKSTFRMLEICSVVFFVSAAQSVAVSILMMLGPERCVV